MVTDTVKKKKKQVASLRCSAGEAIRMALMISKQHGGLPIRCHGVWSKEVMKMLRNEYGSI